MINVKGPVKSSKAAPKPKFAGCFGNGTYTHEVPVLLTMGRTVLTMDMKFVLRLMVILEITIVLLSLM